MIPPPVDSPARAASLERAAGTAKSEALGRAIGVGEPEARERAAGVGEPEARERATGAGEAGSLGRAIGAIPLVDHHVHGALDGDPSRRRFEELITESDRPVPAWMTQFDSQLGFAVLRHCAPVLGLDPHPDPETYLARRAELGAGEVNRRLLAAAGVGHFLLETGYGGEEILGPAPMAALTGRPVEEVVRLESVAEGVVAEGTDAAGFAARFEAALWERTRTARGLKSIVAYRYGLDVDPAPPTPAEVAAAAGRWLRESTRTGTVRVDDPVLLRHLIWTGIGRGLPLQFHIGYGDPDIDLRRSDPLLLRGLVELAEPSGVPLLLLHCYPYHRNAGYLAQVYPHVYFDVGLGVNHTGARSVAVVAESLELAPFAKILFSSDAWGPAELHHLGALLWRRAMTRVLGGFVADGEWSEPQAVRVATMIGARNARRVYGLGETG
ncbi:amidohydrolase [Streptosporangium sp. NBC_01495]|uniref:amidohydrolase family protein n=1 Tax=Streptosporangium sp. NBC_01495 TaxID=2903899 RepID=UPI002E336767|nr:amidohydrolase family protein [Streptosporangium sp. NBC_01495]